MYLWPDSDVTIADGFCGCGGSSLGLKWGGARIKLAMNHNERSLDTHKENFPEALHARIDISQENPKRFPRTTFAWFSPECTNHSNSKGIKLLNQAQLDLWHDREDDPFVERSRATMWDVVRWTEVMEYEAVFVENIPKVHLWRDYSAWLKAMQHPKKGLAYNYQTVYFNSMFAIDSPVPIPQSRDRWYTIFTKKGNPLPHINFHPSAFCQFCEERVGAVQCWKNAQKQRGEYRRQYEYRCPRCINEVFPFYTSAATIIDWDIPAPTIGERKRPLKPKTLRRIQMGLERYCQGQDLEPFLVETCRTDSGGSFTRSVQEAGFTQTTAQSTGVTIPPQSHRTYPLTRAIPTMTSHQEKGIVLPPGPNPFLVKFYGTSIAQPVHEALSTVETSVHHGLIVPPGHERDFLFTYYGNAAEYRHPGDVLPTCTSVERHALVSPSPEKTTLPDINDCRFRMLKLKEIKAAMGFPEDYTIVCTSEKEGVRQCGLAVTPGVAHMLLRAVMESLGY